MGSGRKEAGTRNGKWPSTGDAEKAEPAALANGLPDQILLQPETLPVSGVQWVWEQLVFLGENCL